MRAILIPTPLIILTIVLLALAPRNAGADVIYEFEALSGEVMGVMTFAEPPASGTAGWASSNPGDLLSLFLDDATFGLGAGNVLDLFSNFLHYDVASTGGAELDFSAGGIQDDTPGGAAGGVSDFVQLSFGTSPNVDIVESFANAAFVLGHWKRQALAQPDAPGNLTGRAKLLHVNLTWQGSDTATSFHVFRRLDQEVDFVETGQVANRVFTDDLPSGTVSAEYFVVAENASGQSGPSGIVTVSATNRLRR